ncbi:hypothetical protein [Phyllobacterium endophyticum]|uniref:Uncharacterized protein n=1 Tax=Phyllobacterium endophyticum TaxID=1149773 RepID=A0A2P7AZY9_9HYPH|nr:hypothetical protein [Phyllobacterium endophyticum]MBB3235603.1 hypothetical protein [Phyllobacterium endophyticum]PSH59770.1 hypothetical protein CU100_03115 [Phyllobacterium endophyticum]TYR41917.1 hypothetical protein FY050_11730 [Phyllobacterium endophyticum]
MDKVKGFGEADAFPSDNANARWIWLEFTRPTDRTAFLRNADNSISGFKSLLVCESKPTAGFPAGGQPLCQAASDDGNASASPPSVWIASPSEKQNWLYSGKICSRGEA